MILDTVVPMFVDFFKRHYAIGQGQSVSQDARIQYMLPVVPGGRCLGDSSDSSLWRNAMLCFMNKR